MNNSTLITYVRKNENGSGVPLQSPVDHLEGTTRLASGFVEILNTFFRASVGGIKHDASRSLPPLPPCIKVGNGYYEEAYLKMKTDIYAYLFLNIEYVEGILVIGQASDKYSLFMFFTKSQKGLFLMKRAYR